MDYLIHDTCFIVSRNWRVIAAMLTTAVILAPTLIEFFRRAPRGRPRAQ